MKTSVDVECVWWDPLPIIDVILRRFQGFHHEAMVKIGFEESPLTEPSFLAGFRHVPPDDPRWPKKCDGCDYMFESTAGDIVWTHRRFRCPSTGEVIDGTDLPLGAMSWQPLPVGARCGDSVVLATDGDGDGRSVFVKIPRWESPVEEWHRRGSGVTTWEIDGLTAGSDRFSKKIGRTWTRSGMLPKITVNQPIHNPLGFEGRIDNGRLHGTLYDLGQVP